MKKIAIIDDDYNYGQNLSKLLKYTGFDTCNFYTIINIEDDLMEYKPDLIICDINFPEGQAKAFLKNLRDDKYFFYTPFIVISGMNYLNEKQLYSFGVNEIFYKPTSIHIINRAINKLLARQEEYLLQYKLINIILYFPKLLFNKLSFLVKS